MGGCCRKWDQGSSFERPLKICCQNAAKLEERVSAKLLVLLVDLVGIEPTTSSMPWNDPSGVLLTAKGL